MAPGAGWDTGRATSARHASFGNAAQTLVWGQLEGHREFRVPSGQWKGVNNCEGWYWAIGWFIAWLTGNNACYSVASFQVVNHTIQAVWFVVPVWYLRVHSIHRLLCRIWLIFHWLTYLKTFRWMSVCFSFNFNCVCWCTEGDGGHETSWPADQGVECPVTLYCILAMCIRGFDLL